MTSRVTIINGAVTGGWARHGLIRHDSDTRQVEIVISDRIICYNSDNFPTRQTTCLLAGPQNAILHCTVPRSSFQHSPGQTFTWRHSGFTILKSKYYSVVYLQRDLMIFPEIMYLTFGVVEVSLLICVASCGGTFDVAVNAQNPAFNLRIRMYKY